MKNVGCRRGAQTAYTAYEGLEGLPPRHWRKAFQAIRFDAGRLAAICSEEPCRSPRGMNVTQKPFANPETPGQHYPAPPSKSPKKVGDLNGCASSALYAPECHVRDAGSVSPPYGSIQCMLWTAPTLGLEHLQHVDIRACHMHLICVTRLNLPLN